MELSTVAFLRNYKNSPLLEYSLGELRNSSDPARRGRSKEILTFFEYVEEGKDGQCRAIFRVPSQTTSGKNYAVTIAILLEKGSLFQIAKSKWDAKTVSDVLKNADVKCKCTCPDFKWGGPEYNLASGKFSDSSENDNKNIKTPDITDPVREHILCKHLIAVANRFLANSFYIMKAARQFKPSIIPDNSKKIPLDKDIGFIELPQENKNLLNEGLLKAGDELAKNQTTPEEDKTIISEIIEDKPTGEKPLEKETEEITPEEIIPEIIEPEEEEIIEEEPITAPEGKLDSDLNPVTDENLLSKNKEKNKKQVEEEIDDVLKT